MSQRLTGQVANGDIAKVNFSGDYEAKLLRVEKIDGEHVAAAAFLVEIHQQVEVKIDNPGGVQSFDSLLD